MSLVPTLLLFPYELRRAGLPENIVEIVLGNAQAQLRAFAELSGQVLFGTDVGYITDYDPTDEYVYMARAGLNYAQSSLRSRRRRPRGSAPPRVRDGSRRGSTPISSWWTATLPPTSAR